MLFRSAWIKAQTPGATGATARAGSGLLWSDAAGGGDHFTMAVLGTKLAFETGPGGNPNTISIQDVVGRAVFRYFPLDRFTLIVAPAYPGFTP